MNHAFQLAARAVFLSNNTDIEKFSFELPYVKPDVSANSSIDEDSNLGTIRFRWNIRRYFLPPFYEIIGTFGNCLRLVNVVDAGWSSSRKFPREHYDKFTLIRFLKMKYITNLSVIFHKFTGISFAPVGLLFYNTDKNSIKLL